MPSHGYAICNRHLLLCPLIIIAHLAAKSGTAQPLLVAGAQEPSSSRYRLHAQTSGVSLVAAALLRSIEGYQVKWGIPNSTRRRQCSGGRPHQMTPEWLLFMVMAWSAQYLKSICLPWLTSPTGWRGKSSPRRGTLPVGSGCDEYPSGTSMPFRPGFRLPLVLSDRG